MKLIRLLPLSLFISACHLFHTQQIPFIVSKPACEIGGNEDYYAIAGIIFTFYNTSAKDIESIEVSCMVFDSEYKNNPFIGSNLIKAAFHEHIKSGDHKELIIPLDRYLYHAPDKPYLIDHFFVRKLIFNDGSIWEDKTGVYKI